jgi:hypothetical protein
MWHSFSFQADEVLHIPGHPELMVRWLARLTAIFLNPQKALKVKQNKKG